CARAARVDEILSMGREDAYRRLQAFLGIGPWTAAEVMKIAAGDNDAVSVGDYNLPHQVAWVLVGEARATDERMLMLLEPYRGQRARVIRLIEATGIGAPRFGPRKPLRTIRHS
ncbi:MAG: DNA-3-methyladenine glycosylase 2 family protein, partial [Actinomycetota bacterium]